MTSKLPNMDTRGGGVHGSQTRVMFHPQFHALLMFSFVAAVTPGPTNAMLLIAGVRRGFLGGLPCVLGAVIGMASMMAAAGLGLVSLVQAFPEILVALKVAGAVFLLHLAWRIANAPPMSSTQQDAPVDFWRALAFQWINPKSWVVSISAASTYGAGYPSDAMGVATMLATVFALAATPGCLIWLGFGVALQRHLADPRQSRRFNLGMAIALAGSILLVVR